MMASLLIPPYRTANEDTVSASTWQYGLDQKAEIDLNGLIPHWSRTSRIHLARDLEINIDTLKAETLLHRSEECRLTAVATLVCRTTNTSRCIARSQIEISDWSGNATCRLEGDINGNDIAESFFIRTSLIVEHTGTEPSVWNPQHPGSRVWQETTERIAIEGIGGRFPMQAVDFKTLNALDPVTREQAAWMLHWPSGDVNDSVHARGMRLYVNTNHPHFQMISNNTSAGIEALMMYDISLSLIRRTLMSEPEEIEELDTRIRKNDPPVEDDTVLFIVNNILKQIFPGETMRSIRLEMINNPGRLEAKLQGKTTLQLNFIDTGDREHA